MSQSTLTISGLEDFIQLVLEDQALQDKLQACPDEESLVSCVVQLGQEKGCRFTDEEVRETLAQIREEQEFTYPLSDVLPPIPYCY